MPHDSTASTFKLRRPVDATRDHVRGGDVAGAVTVVVYADYLCPCRRRLRRVLKRLRHVLGRRLQYVFRHFRNERAHPGAEFAARVAEAAPRQGRFWEVHDWHVRQSVSLRCDRPLLVRTLATGITGCVVVAVQVRR
jgi:NhaA family Na+:H+ antiporter